MSRNCVSHHGHVHSKWTTFRGSTDREQTGDSFDRWRNVIVLHFRNLIDLQHNKCRRRGDVCAHWMWVVWGGEASLQVTWETKGMLVLQSLGTCGVKEFYFVEQITSQYTHKLRYAVNLHCVWFVKLTAWSWHYLFYQCGLFGNITHVHLFAHAFKMSIS